MKFPSNPECVYGNARNQLDIIHAYDIQYIIYIHMILPNGAADLNPMKKIGSTWKSSRQKIRDNMLK